MKKSVSHTLLFGIILASAVMISSSSLFAQRRSQQDEKIRYEERNRPNQIREYDRKDRYNRSNYNSEIRHRKKNLHSANRDRKQRKNREYNSRKHRKVHIHKHYHNYHYKKHQQHRNVHSHYRYRHFYNDYGHSCYRHDRYGNVIVRFASAPLVIHHQYGDYYFSDGYYYRLYPEVGFVLVDPPASVYFNDLPEDCHRVRHNGRMYYTNGDVCFVKHRRGFRLVKAPSGIHFSLRF